MEVDELREEVRSMNTIVEPVFNRTVHNYIKWYMEGPEGYTASLMERSALYFPYIEQQLQKEGLPDELKYLVVIESSVKPKIRSHMGAVGLWQLMIPTARYCGLTIDYFVDERMDPERSTKAAIIYLKELYAQFEDWSLVMAAYNSGPGRLRRAMRMSGSDNYWEVSRYLPRETRKYVPKFIAAQYFFNKLYKNELYQSNVSNDLLLTTEVRLTQPTSLYEVSQVTGVEFEILDQLNTSWRRRTIGNAKANYTVRMPSRVVDLWLKYEAEKEAAQGELDTEEKGQKLLYTAEQYYYTIQYPVQKGESIEDIADLFGLNPVLIQWWNNLEPSTEIKEGQTIKIILAHNDACIYIDDVIKDANDINSLERIEIDQIQRPLAPINGMAVDILKSSLRKEDERVPVIVPRGMSMAEFVNIKK
jgi:membrane-bound lytic murein transglycosylase D